MKVEIKVPSLGESITEATVSNLFKQTGASVKMDDEILELETDKVNQVINAPESGVLTVNVNVEDIVKVGQVLGFIDTEEKQESTQVKEPKPQPEEKAPPKEPKIEEKERDSEEDFLQEVKQEKSEEEPKEQTPFLDGKETRTRMSKLRKIISDKLVSAKNETAMLTTFNEVDMSEIISFREKEQGNFQKKYGVKLGFMSFFVKGCIAALKKHPQINGYIDRDEIVYRNYYDIGVAVGSEKGLLVPVIKDADQKSFAEIEKEIQAFAEKAKQGSISVDDLQGGSFTISNGGVYGSLLSTPILNPPQSGILGMHAIQKRVVVVQDEMQIRPMMYLALSYDHRIVDGQGAISFLVDLKKSLEDPTCLLVNI